MNVMEFSWLYLSAQLCVPNINDAMNVIEFSWLYLSAQLCVPNYNDAMNDIFDLQRDLHANGFALREEHTFGTRTLLFAFLFLSQRVGLRSTLGFSSHLLFTLQLFASVFWPWRCVFVTLLARESFSHQCSTNQKHCSPSKLSKLVFVCLTLTELGMMTLSVHTIVVWA